MATLDYKADTCTAPTRPKLATQCSNCPHRPPPAELTPLVFGKLVLDRATCRGSWEGRDLGLTYTEYAVVLEFMQDPGRWRTYRRLYDVMRGEGFLAGEGEDGYRVNVRSCIKRLRRKLANAGAGWPIQNSQAVGYRWQL